MIFDEEKKKTLYEIYWNFFVINICIFFLTQHSIQ